MNESIRIATVPIEEALRSAIIASWDDLSTLAAPRAIRIEYLCQPGIHLDDLTIWLVSAGGYQQRVCDYRTGPFSRHPREWRCWARVHSATLFGALDFIMRHQEQFSLAADATSQGLVVVFPPDEQERAAAASWMAETNLAAQPVPLLRARAAAFTSVS